MHFDFDQRRYVVQIAPRTLVLDGQPCRAKLDRTRAIIWLSDQLPSNGRRLALFHELRHLWIDTHGKAVDEESDADQAAEMMDAMLEQYLAQGGDAVLESLIPDPDTSINRATTSPMIRFDPTCGECNARLLPGAIGTDAPIWNADLSTWTMDRGCLCEICDHVTVWRETATADGVPLGSIVAHPQPRVLSGGEAGVWIEGHAKVCRVLVRD